MNIRIIALPLFFFVLACCCGFAAELVPVYVEKTPVEIVGGYSLGRPTQSGLRLYGQAYTCYDDPSATCYPTIVEQSVVKIGWNQDFIIIERHPRAHVIFSTPDATNPSWFIVVLSTSTVYEDLSYEDFNQLMITLEIPAIEMQDAMDVYRRK